MRHDRDLDPRYFPPAWTSGTGPWLHAIVSLLPLRPPSFRNLVVLTGDIHNNWAGDLKKNFDDPGSATLGVEFVATSISSGGDGFDTNDSFQAGLAHNPHMKFFNNQRGYVRHVITPERWQADFLVLDRVSSHDGQVSTRKSFVIEYGSNGLADA